MSLKSQFSLWFVRERSWNVANYSLITLAGNIIKTSSFSILCSVWCESMKSNLFKRSNFESFLAWFVYLFIVKINLKELSSNIPYVFQRSKRSYCIFINYSSTFMNINMNLVRVAGLSGSWTTWVPGRSWTTPISWTMLGNCRLIVHQFHKHLICCSGTFVNSS